MNRLFRSWTIHAPVRNCEPSDEGAVLSSEAEGRGDRLNEVVGRRFSGQARLEVPHNKATNTMTIGAAEVVEVEDSVGGIMTNRSGIGTRR